MMRLQVLGAADLLSREGIALDAVLAQPKRTALLCYLAVATPRGFHRRDVIKAVFWPEHDAEQAVTAGSRQRGSVASSTSGALRTPPCGRACSTQRAVRALSHPMRRKARG